MRPLPHLMLALPALLGLATVAVPLLALPADADDAPAATALAAAIRFTDLDARPRLEAQFSPDGMAAAAGLALPTGLDPELTAEIRQTVDGVRRVVVPAMQEAAAEVLARRLPPDLLNALADYAASPAGRAATAARAARSLEPDLHDARLSEPDAEMKAALISAASARGLTPPREMRFPATGNE